MTLTNITKTLITTISYMIIQKYEVADINRIANELTDYLKIDLQKSTPEEILNFKQRLRHSLNNLVKNGLIVKEQSKNSIYKNYVIYKLNK